jgi:hypothetical protein
MFALWKIQRPSAAVFVTATEFSRAGDRRETISCLLRPQYSRTHRISANLGMHDTLAVAERQGRTVIITGSQSSKGEQSGGYEKNTEDFYLATDDCQLRVVSDRDSKPLSSCNRRNLFFRLSSSSDVTKRPSAISESAIRSSSSASREPCRAR